MSCVFCEIVKGNIPCYKIFENETTMAFLDIGSEGYGHTLVIPKKHCENIFDCDEIVLQEVIKTVKQVSKHYLKCGFSGVNVLNANDVSAQQSVFHLHFHIIPRKNGDNIDAFPHIEKDKVPLAEVCEYLKIKE